MRFGVRLLHRCREAAGGGNVGSLRVLRDPTAVTDPLSCPSSPTSPSSCRHWGLRGGGQPGARRAPPAPRPAAASCTERAQLHPCASANSRSPPTAPGPSSSSDLPAGLALHSSIQSPGPADPQAPTCAKGKLRHGRSAAWVAEEASSRYPETPRGITTTCPAHPKRGEMLP